MEAAVSSQDSQRIITGAVIGAGIAFLFLTRKGKHLLGSAEPWIDDLIHDIQRVRTAAGDLFIVSRNNDRPLIFRAARTTSVARAR